MHRILFFLLLGASLALAEKNEPAPLDAPYDKCSTRGVLAQLRRALQSVALRTPSVRAFWPHMFG
jgi:hypothetical protein